MFCNKCGAEVKEDDKFCNKCGAPQKHIRYEDTAAGAGADPRNKQNSERNTEDIISKKNRSFLIAVIAVLLLLVVGALVFMVLSSGEKEDKYGEQLKLAESYFDEQDYDRAVAACKAAIDIDPARPEAYLRLAEVYAAQEEYRDAIDTLEKGYTKTGDERMTVKISEIKSVMRGKTQTPEVSSTTAAEAEPEEAEEVEEEEQERVWQEIAMADIPEKEQLDKLLDSFVWHIDYDIQSVYDSSDPFADYPDVYERDDHKTVIDWIVADVPCVPFEEYPIEQPRLPFGPDQIDKDPLGKIEICQCWKEESIDWILTNILNVASEDIEKMKERWKDTSGNVGRKGYYYDGYYYGYQGGVGDTYVVNIVDSQTDGVQYKITYEVLDAVSLYMDGNTVPYGQREALMELKTIDGKKYWSIYIDGFVTE